MNISHEVILETNNNEVLLHLRGVYNLSLLNHAIKEVGSCCRQTGYRRVLADARGHLGGIDILELHQIGELISREIPGGCRVAVVVSKARLAMDRHLETVAVNRGVSLRLFTDMDDADLWLKKSKAAATNQPGFMPPMDPLAQELESRT